MIFFARSWAVIFASTFAPVRSGRPIFGAPSSPPRSKTSLKVTLSPTLPESFSTRSLSPGKLGTAYRLSL